jgi:transposase
VKLFYSETQHKKIPLDDVAVSIYNYIREDESNIIKLEKKIRLMHRKLSNIRNNHLHQATTKIVKTKPSRVVMETLNVKGI